MFTANAPEIQDKISYLKDLKKSGAEIITNCYVNNFNNNEVYEFYNSERSIFFIKNDHGVNRIFYYTTDYEDLGESLKALPLNQEYIIEFMTKYKDENSEVLARAGFEKLAALMRMSNPDCSAVFNSNSELNKFFSAPSGKVAEISDTEEINEKLWEIFDTRISHLLYDNELAEIINQHEILISRDTQNKIIAILQTVTQPRRFYINQVYNSGEKFIIHGMLLNKLKKYCENGGKYLYAWVDETNAASLKFHAKYGLKHDGMWNLIYSKKT